LVVGAAADHRVPDRHVRRLDAHEPTDVQTVDHRAVLRDRQVALVHLEPGTRGHAGRLAVDRGGPDARRRRRTRRGALVPGRVDLHAIATGRLELDPARPARLDLDGLDRGALAVADLLQPALRGAVAPDLDVARPLGPGDLDLH